jgi:hypothetical protein
VKDFAEIIAGRSPRAAAAGARESPHAHSPMADDFVSMFSILGVLACAYFGFLGYPQYSVTRNLAQSIPPHIFNFGALGTVPYIGTAAGIVFLAREASVAQKGE